MDKQAVLNGASFKLVEKSEKIFRLKQEKWNDYVYNTLFSLWMTPPGKPSICISMLRIFNLGQKMLDKPGWW